MQAGKPSRTALRVAAHRAAHQILENAVIFSDPLALQILGADGTSATEISRDARMRLFVAARSRIAEDALAEAVARGVRQLVVLGAGLDTFAYRNPFKCLRVFEVDYPATQAWKHERLTQAGIAVPDSLVFVPIDFERENLADRLDVRGFDRKEQSFFTWLGVVPYLKKEAIWPTLEFIGGLPGGAHLVLDYPDPPDTLSPELRAYHEEVAARAAGIGEPWVTFFEPEELHARLRAFGLIPIEDLGPREMAARFMPSRVASSPERGGHILRAASMTQ